MSEQDNKDRTRFAYVKDQFSKALQHTADGPYAQISDLWSTLLSHRENFPEYDAFALSLSSAASNAVGVGVAVGPAPDAAVYLDQYQTWVERISGQFSAEQLALWPEPRVGSPTIVEHRGYRSSVLYIKNFAQSLLFETFLAKHHRRQQKLNVLEIGAGYGGVAEILIRKGIADRYTIVDLPQNLFLSAQYLSLTHPHLSSAICDRYRPATFRDFDLRFALPNDIVHIEGNFDLVINAYSLGEMPAATAQAYVTWISKHLAENGIFISHNADRVRGAADVIQRHSDYGYRQFAFEGVYPNLPAGGPIHIQHLIFVLSQLRDNVTAQPEWTDFDCLSALLNLGLNDEVEDVCGFFTNRPTSISASFLEIMRKFYASKSSAQMYEVASTRLHHESCDLALEFLQGAAAFMVGNPIACTHFLRYLTVSRSPMAIAIAAIVLRLWDRSKLNPEAEKIFNAALTRVPLYVVKQLGNLKLEAAQARFSTYLRLA